MSARCDCYGTMLPDFMRLEKNKALTSVAFTALVQSHGIGVQGRKLEVNWTAGKGVWRARTTGLATTSAWRSC